MSYKVTTDVMVPMRDGTKLATNLWVPDGEGRFPTLLVRTPYGKDMMVTYNSPIPNIFMLMRNGYAVAMQECRGTFVSEGLFVPHVHEADDGFDTVQWLVGQHWCDGNIGTYGASYLGFVQWDLAATGVPALKAIAPAVTTGDPFRSPWHSPGGALSLGISITWATIMALQEVMRRAARGEDVAADLSALATDMTRLDAVCAHTPITDHPLLRKYLPFMMEVPVGHPDRDEAWSQLSAVDRAASITTPALHIGGWYDLFLTETLRGYAELTANAATAEARDGQMLVIGPWGHSPNGYIAMYKDRLFGGAGTAEASQLTERHLAHFDRWLKGRADALDDFAPVRLFIMGLDQWRDEQAWPLPDTHFIDYHLGGEGPANTARGSGTLSPAIAETAYTDTYLYDPRRPVPSLGGVRVNVGGWDGPADQREVHARDDVLCFTSEVLSDPLEVTGPVSATLYVASSAVDTDFTAKLVDLFPDGRAIILCDGIQRMRYRKSLAASEMMTPGEVYEITIDMAATANVFLPGHRLLVEVSSSNFPRFDRNSNTGGVIAEEREEAMIAAVNSVRRGGAFPSRVTLPIIRR